jgi:hypothetical protein
MKKTTITIIGIIAMLIFTECKKYQEGPLISFRSKKSRIEGKWKYSKVLFNDIEKTSEFINAELEFGTDGSFCNKRNTPVIDPPQESKGTWTLANNDLCIDLTSVGFYGGTTVQRWNILKLKKGELWLEYIGYDCKIQWQMTGGN